MIKQYIYLYTLSLNFLLAQDLFKTHPYGKLGSQKNLTSSIGLGDLDAVYGAGNDIRMYHDGSNSYLTNATGGLHIECNENNQNLFLKKATGGDIRILDSSSNNTHIFETGGANAMKIWADQKTKFFEQK